MNYVKAYIEKIRSGEIVTSKKVKKLYFNIIEPIINDEHPRYYFNEKRGEKFIVFAESFCKQSKGEWFGKKTKLALFQKAKYQALLGILERETNVRRFKESFDVRGRKNGKSTENAILGLYLTLTEPGAEIYVSATVSSQARRVWEESQSMIDQSKELQSKLHYKVFPSPTIYNKATKSTYKVLSKNVKTFDGLNASGAIIDEIHELARAIYDILKQSMSARQEALLSMITTAGFVRGGLFDDTYEYSTKVLDGIIEDDRLFPLIYELDDPKEIDIESCWIKANPAIDIIKKREDIRYNVNRMKEDLNFANTVKTKDFNIIGVENRAWLSYEDFNVTDIYPENELRKFDNTLVLGGFDLSRTKDITAFTTLLFDKEKHRPIAVSMYWITAKFLSEQMFSASKIPWNAWIDRGLIRISGKELIDYHDVANYVASNFKTFGWMYHFINYDSYSAQYLIEELASMGYAKDFCLIATPQGAKTLSIPMQTLEAHLKENILCYQNNPVTKWMLSNVELEQDRNGNYMPKKASDKRERKIDGVATLLNCYVSLCKNMDYYLT
jgi:phage terminase large subunit-like protein